ncbi:MAG: RNA methyltransferase [Acidobacteriaceae bacterium]
MIASSASTLKQMPASAVITSRTNPRVKQLRAALAGNARLADSLIAIEGPNLITEAIRSGIALVTVFLAEGTSLPHDLPPAVELLHIGRETFASACSTESPQGIAALLEPPELILPLDGRPLLLIAAGLQDPGNLGTLIRSAEAFGAAGVLLTPGTVSPWNGKTMRASAGSIFRVPVQTIDISQLSTLSARGIRLLAAVTADAAPHFSSSVPITHLDLTDACAFLIGNEGLGLSADLLALAETRITIPTPGPVESLNAGVAGSLLLYEAARQRQGRSNRMHAPQHTP